MKKILMSRPDGQRELERIRQKLSISGDVVSPAARAKTIEVFGEPLTPQQVVTRICHDVRERGAEALLEYTRKLDGVELTPETLRVSEGEIEQAHRAADPQFLEAVRRIRANIWRFQTEILANDVTLAAEGQWELRLRYRPMRRVGVCVPGGAAAYPSTVLMTVVPAQAAGVKEIAIVSPPTATGANNPAVLAVCRELGVREVYRVGGAQAVAALAFGCGPIRPVDKIVGPGNLFVTLAKREVFGHVDIDMLAGPSEVVVLADESAEPEFAASELIAQAEHSPGAAFLVSWHERLADAVAAAIQRQLEGLERAELARSCLEEFGALIVATDEQQAVQITNSIAPEHLVIMTADPDQTLERIESAGAIFLGPHSPVAVGDYVAGPSHVLPTGGSARFASGLSSLDFLKRSSVIKVTAGGLERVAADLRCLAECEGLTAHWASVAVRLR